ncbi:MAG: hypothetical protein U5R31_17735 [Acidimicrobiia bacterium]|nr:hypothetical protein [Acidimicrobiia bacterium]
MRADYVHRPDALAEPAEDTRGYGHFNDEPFVQFTCRARTTLQGTAHDWEFYLRLAQAMGLTLRHLAGDEADGPDDPVPTDVEVL